MTDVPAFAVQCVFLALAFRRAARARDLGRARTRARWPSASSAISIRQYEAIPVIAFVIVTFVVAVRGTAEPGSAALAARDRRRRRRHDRAVRVVAVAARRAQPGAEPGHVGTRREPGGAASAASSAWSGLLLVPLVLFVGPGRHRARRVASRPRSSPRWSGAGTALWMAASYLRVPDVPFVGNYVDLYGVLSRDVLTGTRVPVIPENLFRLLAVVGSVGRRGARARGRAGARRRRPPRARRATSCPRDPVTAVLGLSVDRLLGRVRASRSPPTSRCSTATCCRCCRSSACSSSAGTPAPAAVAAVRAGARRRGRARWWVTATTVVALVVLGGVGLAYATDSASFDGTRWQVDRGGRPPGWKPTRIYGGFEWISWHQKVGPPQGDTQAERIRLRARYLAPFCVDVVINPGPAKARAAIARWRRARARARRRADRRGPQRQAVPGRLHPAGARPSVRLIAAEVVGRHDRHRRAPRSCSEPERAVADGERARRRQLAEHAWPRSAPMRRARRSRARPARSVGGASPACARSRTAPRDALAVDAAATARRSSAVRPSDATTTAVPGAVASPSRAAARSNATRFAGGATSATRPPRPTATASSSTAPAGTACAPTCATSASTHRLGVPGPGQQVRARGTGTATSWTRARRRGPGAPRRTTCARRSITPIAASPNAAGELGRELGVGADRRADPSSTASRTRAVERRAVAAPGALDRRLDHRDRRRPRTVSVTRPALGELVDGACDVASHRGHRCAGTPSASCASQRVEVGHAVAARPHQRGGGVEPVDAVLAPHHDVVVDDDRARRGRARAGAAPRRRRASALTSTPRRSTATARRTRRRGRRRPAGSTAPPAIASCSAASAPGCRRARTRARRRRPARRPAIDLGDRGRRVAAVAREHDRAERDRRRRPPRPSTAAGTSPRRAEVRHGPGRRRPRATASAARRLAERARLRVRPDPPVVGRSPRPRR